MISDQELAGYMADPKQVIEDFLVINGGKQLLLSVAEVLRSLEGAGTAATIGRVIESLAELEW